MPVALFTHLDSSSAPCQQWMRPSVLVGSERISVGFHPAGMGPVASCGCYSDSFRRVTNFPESGPLMVCGLQIAEKNARVVANL